MKPSVSQRELVARRSSRSCQRRRLSSLEMGCGQGQVAHQLASSTLCASLLVVVTTDINEKEIEEARHNDDTNAVFLVPNVTQRGSVDPPIPSCTKICKLTLQDDSSTEQDAFDFVILQLLISIVGRLEDWKQTLRNVVDSLREGRTIYLLASGTSDTINPKYAQLYQQDAPLTGECYAYFSRDTTVSVLYVTHHFSVQELEQFSWWKTLDSSLCKHSRAWKGAVVNLRQRRIFFILRQQKLPRNKDWNMHYSVRSASAFQSPRARPWNNLCTKKPHVHPSTAPIKVQLIP